MAVDRATETFHELWMEVLGLEKVEDHQNFFKSGGDSLLVVRLMSRCREHGLNLTAKDVYRLQTLGAITEQLHSRETNGAVLETQEKAAEGTYYTLLPTQQRWVDGTWEEVDHFNIGGLVSVPADLQPAVLHEALETVLTRQEALRTAYRQTEEGWVAQVMPVNLDAVLLRAEHQDYRNCQEQVAAEVAKAHRSMRIEDGIVFRVMHLPFGDEPGLLLMLIHHLTLDGFSVNLLVDEIDNALLCAMEGRKVEGGMPLPPRRYSEAAVQWVATEEAAADAKKWLALPWDQLGSLPQEQEGEGLLTSIKTVVGSVSAEQTEQLAELGRELGLGLNEILIAAALGAIAEWSGEQVQGVDAYYHGRELTPMGVDVMETIAYVLNTHPILVNWEGMTGEGNWLERVAPQFKLWPERLYGFDALRYYDNPVREQMAALPRPELRFNFRGHMKRIVQRNRAVVQPSAEPIGRNRSPLQTERYLLMLEGDVMDGSLIYGIKFSQDLYTKEAIQRLVDRTVELLVEATVRQGVR